MVNAVKAKIGSKLKLLGYDYSFEMKIDDSENDSTLEWISLYYEKNTMGDIYQILKKSSIFIILLQKKTIIEYRLEAFAAGVNPTEYSTQIKKGFILRYIRIPIMILKTLQKHCLKGKF